MNVVADVVTTYNFPLVGLSFALAVLGSFVALTAARRIVLPNGRLSKLNMLMAGLGLGGIGVWSMHFVGMQALKMDVASGYALLETLVSLVAAVAAATLALSYVAKDPKNLARLIAAGVLLGLGVGFMHYLGMWGIRFGGYVQWSYGIVALSLVIAVVASTAALWLAFNTRSLLLRLVASCVMAVAVCAMHYTGMEAAQFICTTANRQVPPTGFGIINTFQLPLLVTLISVCLAVVILLDQLFQSLFLPSTKSKA